MSAISWETAACTPKGFAGLSKLKKLTFLSIRGSGSGDNELLSAVRAMPKLKSIDLELEALTDEGLANIVSNSTASYVNFQRSPVGPRTIHAVKARKTVKKFCTDRYRITKTQEADLKTARPELELDIEY